MKKKSKNPELIDDENPEWTREDFQKALPAAEALPMIFGAEAAEKMLNKGGRPRKQEPAKNISIRLHPKVEARFRSMGKGWQSRLNHVLLEWVESHPV